MRRIGMHQLIQSRLLTARESVDAVTPHLIGSILSDDSTIALDFSGLGAVSPSAIDQLLINMEAVSVGRDIQFFNMPRHASRAHEAIARAHGRVLMESEPQSWVFKAPAVRHA